MRAGRLRERVTFQRLDENAGDGRGNFGNEFVDIPGAKKIAANMKPIRGTEVTLAEGIQGRILYEIEVRYSAALAGILVADRMVDTKTGRVMNVKAPPINPDQRRRALIILVEWGGANG